MFTPNTVLLLIGKQCFLFDVGKAKGEWVVGWGKGGFRG
ncbi:MAG: hypothetical protein RLZZ490_1829 [Cyanobacteriota bacterium]